MPRRQEILTAGDHRGFFPGGIASCLIAAMAALAALILMSSYVLRPDISEWRLGATELLWIEPAPQDLQLRRPVLGEEIHSARSPPLPGQAAQFYHIFNRADLPDRPIALLIPAAGGEITNVYLNGAPIFGPHRSSERHLLHQGGRTLLVPLDEPFFHRGQNRLDIAIGGHGNRALTGTVFLGPETELANLYSQFESVSTSRMILAIAAGAASLLSFIAALLARQRRKFVLAGIVATLLAMLASLPHLAAAGLNAVQIASVERLLLAALIYAKASWIWAAAGGGRLTPRMLAGAIIISMAASISALGLAAANPAIAWWLTTAGLVLAALFLAVLVGHRAREVLAMSPGKAGLTLSAAALLLAAAFPALGLVPETGLLAAEFIYRLLFLSFTTVLLAAAGRRIFRETRQYLASGFDQAALIAAQREEIAEKTSALAYEERRRAVLEERQRLLRDMHDGVGGQLVSLLVRIRGSDLPKKEIETELRSSLTDLRLIVDSLDTAGDSLSGALIAFQDRAAPQLAAAGIELEWQQSEVPDTEITEPRALLNLYRWMQEALANAIRHANASRVRISVNASGRHLTVAVEDDGSGLPQDVIEGHRSGKGLKSMQARAREMGGESVCTSANLPSGTRCEIRLPLTAFGVT